MSSSHLFYSRKNMALLFPTTVFPANARVKNDSGLPWGCSIQPLGFTSRFTSGPPADAVPRCSQCFSYIHWQTRFDAKNRWVCSFCGATSQALGPRYSSAQLRTGCPELREQAYECPVMVEDHSLPKTKQLINMFVVGLSERPEYLSAVKFGLQAALEALPATAMICLVTFSADSLNIYDLASQERAHLKQILLAPDNSDSDVFLNEICPLDLYSTQLNASRAALAVAIDSISDETVKGKILSGSALTQAIDHLLDWVSAADESAGILVNIQAFWCGGEPESQSKLAAIEASANDIVLRAAPLGVSISGYTFYEGDSALASLKGLFSGTGGGLFSYSSSTVAQLPQDVHRHISLPTGYHCLLRLRASTGFRVARAYGPMQPDVEHAGLFRMSACNTHTSIAFDFEFDESSTFDEMNAISSASGAIVQLAFSYVIPVPLVSEGSEEESAVPQQYKLMRKLRIVTQQISLCPTVRDIYLHVEPTAILSLLTHKVIRAAQSRGLTEARMLLQDWLCIFLARYNDARNDDTVSKADRQRTVDVHLAKNPNLQTLIRYVFGLLKSPLLDPSCSANERAVLETQFSSISPAFLALAVYPRLSAFDSFDCKTRQILRLSRQSIVQNGAPVMLLDAYFHLIIYINSTSPDLASRPSKDSALWNLINTIRSERPCVPSVVVLQAGSEGAASFSHFLVEDSGFSGKYGSEMISCTNFAEFMIQLEPFIAKELS